MTPGTLQDVLDMTVRGKMAHDLLTEVNQWLWTHKSREFFDHEAGDHVVYGKLKDYFKTYNGEFDADY